MATIDDVFTASRTNTPIQSRITAGEVTNLPDENYQKSHGQHTKHAGMVKFTYTRTANPEHTLFIVESVLGMKVYSYATGEVALINSMLAKCDGILEATQLMLKKENAYLAHAIANDNQVSGDLYLCIPHLAKTG